MKVKRAATVCMLAVVVFTSPLVRAEGDPLTEEALDVIRTTCTNAQVSIQRIQQADKPTRINRGYLYETILKLMVNFNSRVAQNKIDSPELLTITSDYEKQLKSFTSDYTRYDEGLSTLTTLDCRAEPTKFNDGLVEARRLRESLNKATTELDALLNHYQTNVDAVKGIAEANI